MGLPFNFFGFTELPFILQGSFLFDDDWSLNWDWSGSWTGISPDVHHINFDWSGKYKRDVDPERFAIGWEWSGRFSGVHDEFVAHSLNPYGEYTGALTEVAFLNLNATGIYERERQDDYYVGNTLDRIELKPISQNHYDFRIEVPKIKLTGILKEVLTLGADVPKIKLEHHGISGQQGDRYTYGFKLDGIYQKDPGSTTT